MVTVTGSVLQGLNDLICVIPFLYFHSIISSVCMCVYMKDELWWSAMFLLIHKFGRVRRVQSLKFWFVIYSTASPLFFVLQCFWCIVCCCPLQSFAPSLYSILTLSLLFLPLSNSFSILSLGNEQYFTTHHSCVSIAKFPIKSMSQQMSFNFYLLWCNDIFCLFYSRSTAFAITTLFSVSKKSY